MAKFNTTATIKTTNHSGHAAYSMDDKTKLVTMVLTSFFNEAKFYGDNSKELTSLIPRVIEKDAAFVSNLAVFARREFNMRSVSHVLTAFLAHSEAGKPFVRQTVKGVSLRGDDITEIMAFYLSTFGKPVPNSLKKGISDVLITLDEYSLAKYKGENNTVKMRDLLCLCRPTPKDDAQSAMWKRCLERTLQTPVTWETQLSANGNNAETWEKLIDSGKVGYMALLRNLRNIIQAKPSNVDNVLEIIRDHERVKKSRQLPFRFLSAYKSVSGIASSKVFDALEDAADASLQNLPKLPGKTVIAVDVSGSMSDLVSAKSDVHCYEIAVLLGLMFAKNSADTVLYTFNNNIEKVPVSSRVNILYAAQKFRCGGGTYMHLPFQKMIVDHVNADRIIILSDNECNGGWWNKPVQAHADEYRKKTGNDIWVHAVDLQGYGTQQFHGKKTNIIAGWSEKILDFIRLAEQGEGNLVSTIQNYKW